MSDTTIVFPAAGQKARRRLAFDAPALAGLTWPYFALSGAHDGPTLCVIAGLHGAEYPPIDAVMRFCRDLDPASVRGRVIGLPVANLPAFWERTPFVCPRDGKNPNRVFPGTPNGTFTEVLAAHIFEQVVRRGDYLIDLHGGDMVEDLTPFSVVQQTDRVDLDAVAVDLATVFGLPYLVVEAADGAPISGTMAGAASAAGIPAFIAEAGAIGQLQTEAVDLHLRGLRRVLQRLKMRDGTLEALQEPVVMREFAWSRAERGGFFRKKLAAGDYVEAGGRIGTMVDFWGDPLAEITSPVGGIALFVTTSPAVADNGLLVGIIGVDA